MRICFPKVEDDRIKDIKFKAFGWGSHRHQHGMVTNGEREGLDEALADSPIERG